MKKKGIPVVALLPLLSACTLMGPSEEHTTLEQAPEPLEVPASVASVGWDWQPPDNTGITHVSPTQNGVAVAVGDGVVALAGDTGEEHWHYRRPGEPITSAAVTPDGRKVMLSYAGDHTDEEDEDDPPAENEVVLLDSATGDIISQHTIDFSQPTNGLDSNVYRGNQQDPGIITDKARVTQENHQGAYGDIVAYSLENGEDLWNALPEPPDTLPEKSNASMQFGMVVDGTLVLSLLFASPESEGSATLDDQNDYALTLLGLDQKDGSELWRHDTTLMDYAGIPRHQMGVDESAGVLFASIRPTYDTGENEWVLDAQSGETVTDVDFISGRDEEIIGPVNNQVAMVNKTETEEGEALEYTYEDLSGEVQASFTTEAPLGRAVATSFLVPLPGSLTWLDVNDYSDDPAQLVVTDTHEGTSHTLDLGGIQIDRRPTNDGTPTHSVFPAPEAMTLAPGTLVVQGERDDDELPTDTLVGIVP